MHEPSLEYRKIYYLQQMGIDVWEKRKDKSYHKILVLVSNSYDQQVISKSARTLLENILSSICVVKREDFEIVFVDTSLYMDCIGSKMYAAIIIMGEDVWNDANLEQQKTTKGPLIVSIPHPSYLLINPRDKRKAYLELCKLFRAYPLF